jgi:hypothetical protein
MGALLATSYQAAVPGQGNCRHTTEGWKALESSVRCLHRIVSGTGKLFAASATPELRQLVYKCFSHMNRFVRETAFNAQAALCEALAGTDELDAMGVEMAERVNDGLSDNWSQVISHTLLFRHKAASVPIKMAEITRFSLLTCSTCCLRHPAAAYHIRVGHRVMSSKMFADVQQGVCCVER